MLSDNGINYFSPWKINRSLQSNDKTINLSVEVYQGRHVSAAAVAAHECGHAIQHATCLYQWLQLRSQMVPLVNYSNKMMSVIFLIGIFWSNFLKKYFLVKLIMLFIILQTIVTTFTLITLPVEFDASNSINLVKSSNITNDKK